MQEDEITMTSRPTDRTCQVWPNYPALEMGRTEVVGDGINQPTANHQCNDKQYDHETPMVEPLHPIINQI